MTKPSKIVQVGVGLFLLRKSQGDMQVLLGLRKGAHGAGEWALPGGKPELWESPEQCAIRETLEETSIKVASVKKLTWFEDRYPSDMLHFVTLFYYATDFEGEAEVMEKDKCERWGWFSLKNLPSNMMDGCFKAFKELENIRGSCQCIK